MTTYTRTASVEAARDVIVAKLVEQELAERAGERPEPLGNTFLFTRARWSAMTAAVRAMGKRPLDLYMQEDEDEEGDNTRVPPAPDCSDEVIEQQAVAQVVSSLSPEHRLLLFTLADTLDANEAAKRLGMSASTFSDRMKQVRQEFIRLWFDGEEPPPTPKYVANRLQRRAETGTDPYASRRGRKAHNRGDRVTYVKKTGRYMARVRHNGKTVYLGVRKTREEAAALVREFEERQEQPAAQQGVRATVG